MGTIQASKAVIWLFLTITNTHTMYTTLTETEQKSSFKMLIEVRAEFMDYNVEIKHVDLSMNGYKHIFTNPKEIVKNMLSRVKGYRNLTVNLSGIRVNDNINFVASEIEYRFIHEYVGNEGLERFKMSMLENERFENWHDCTPKQIYNQLEWVISILNNKQLNS